MPSCDSCGLCVDSCPTGCIGSERFLIHAENCLTNMNEYEEDFPAWVDNSWHYSVIGCMKCQLICPQNNEHIKIDEVEEAFTEEKISLILSKAAVHTLPQSLVETLNRFELMDLYKDNMLSRNLEILINRP